MARPRDTYVSATRFKATSGRETKHFDNKRDASAWATSQRGSCSIEETYFRVRAWELVEEKTGDLSVMGERQFTIRGNDREALVNQAEARRRLSYATHVPKIVHDLGNHTLPRRSVEFARRVLAEWEAAGAAQIAAHFTPPPPPKKREPEAPTLGAIHEFDVKRRLSLGMIKANTAETYAYETAGLRRATDIDGTERVLWDMRVSDLDRRLLDEWFYS